MYRVKVQAISGAKIFADGKWLKCIGNKTFHIGEIVYTDGRCVYGHNTIPQQPLVITSQNIEGIPLIFSALYEYGEPPKFDYFTFLKSLKQIPQEDILPIEGKINFLVNDDKRNVMVVKDGYKIDSERYETIIAANLYKGDLYTLVYSFLDTDESGEDLIKIEKNGETVSIITIFKSIIDENEKACPDAPPAWSPSSANYFSHETFCYPVWSFIENDNKWAFVIAVETRKSVAISFDFPDGETAICIRDQEEHALLRYYYFTANDSYKVALEYYVNNAAWNALTSYIIEEKITKSGTDIKFPLQDNYYFKFDDIHMVKEADRIKEKMLMQRTIFSPNGGEIFTGIFDLWSYITFCKFNLKYLLGVRHQGFQSFTTKYINNIPILDDGLYLLKRDNTAEKIINGTCLNQRLRPMKKYKNWNQRIQEINFE